MRTIHVEEIVTKIKEMCIEANYYLTEDMKEALKHSVKEEEAPIGKQILGQLEDNLEIAAKDKIARIPEWQLFFWRLVRMCT